MATTTTVVNALKTNWSFDTIQVPLLPPTHHQDLPQKHEAIVQQQEIPTQTSALLQIPTDVLLLIRDQLDLPTSASLSLTCRDAFALLNAECRRLMTHRDRTSFLKLLEGDPLARGLYYCHPCGKLHPFKSYWGPRSQLEDSEQRKSSYHCGKRDRFSPIGNHYELGFTHAHLAMNRHLYGPEYGIPLENLCVEYSSARDVVTINCQSDVKVIADELHLHRIYTFIVPKSDVAALRKCTGNRDFRICEHTSFFQNSSVYRQYMPELSRRPFSGGEGLQTCFESPGSCGLCLMDYDVTITSCNMGPAGEEIFEVTIRTWHELGACRAPDDWKWARFTETCRPHLFFPNRPNRRGSTVYPGTVKKAWMEDADGSAFSPRTRETSEIKRPSTSGSLSLVYEVQARDGLGNCRDAVTATDEVPEGGIAWNMPNWNSKGNTNRESAADGDV